MANPKSPLRGVIFDYGSTLIWLGPERRSARTDYADVVARPGAERLARFLVSEGVLNGDSAASEFIERYLEIRERNRAQAEETGREITARESLIRRSVLGEQRSRPPRRRCGRRLPRRSAPRSRRSRPSRAPEARLSCCGSAASSSR